MQIKERSLLFTQENFQLVISGGKTQTRRPVQPRDELIHSESLVFGRGCSQLWDKRDRRWVIGDVESYIVQERERGKQDNPCSGCWYEAVRSLKHPYGVPGDLFYLCEPTQVLSLSDSRVKIRWLYDDAMDWVEVTPLDLEKLSQRKDWRKPCSSRFMLKSFARHWVRQNSIWVERLHQISMPDIFAEGVRALQESACSAVASDILFYDYGQQRYCPLNTSVPLANLRESAARQSFQSLWDSLNQKKFPWSKNPFVYALQFQRVTQPDLQNSISFTPPLFVTA